MAAVIGEGVLAPLLSGLLGVGGLLAVIELSIVVLRGAMAGAAGEDPT